MPRPELVPAAQYVRMSDESQHYSIENQKAVIQEYAAKFGFVTVKTYADPGRSGVVAKRREGLRQLLNDVINGSAATKRFWFTTLVVGDDFKTPTNLPIMNSFAGPQAFQCTTVLNHFQTTDRPPVRY